MALTSAEVRNIVNDRIEQALGQGRVAWQKPWVGEAAAPRNLQSGKQYRGINALLLGLSGYADPRWTTFAAARKMGACVRKGELSTIVTLWKRIRVKDANELSGYRVQPILRYFRVFNIAQVDWPEGTLPELSTVELPDAAEAIDAAENVLTNYIDSDRELSIRFGGVRAYYDPAAHRITLPVRESFLDTVGYYTTAFHEAGHSTGRKLGRKVSNGFGTEPYGREELVAEMTAAFVCAHVGIEPDYVNSTAYIRSWRGAIRNDPQMLIKAAGAAQKAADLILGQLIEYTDETTETATEPVAV